MNSREQAHAEDRRALRAMERRPWLIIAVAVVAMVAATALVYSIVNAHANGQTRRYAQQVRVLTEQAQTAADKAHAQALAGCQAYKLLADAPLTPQTSSYGVSISAAMRIAYSTAQCALGDLTSPDPRVAKLLPPGVK